MAVTMKGQARPSNTTATTLVTGPAEVSFIVVTNVGTQTRDFRIFHSTKRTSALYDETTALHWDIPLGRQETVSVEFVQPIRLTNSSDFLGVRTSSADDLNFTAYGAA